MQYTAKSDRKIAVLSIGYTDSISRTPSYKHVKALINGNEAPIIDRICMDQILADVTDIPNVKSGDIAVMIDKSGSHEIIAYDEVVV